MSDCFHNAYTLYWTKSWNLITLLIHSLCSIVMTGSYNNFFRMIDRGHCQDLILEASQENCKPLSILKPRKVCIGGKRQKDEISVDSLDFDKKILHTAWHPLDNIIAVATTNNLYIYQEHLK